MGLNLEDMDINMKLVGIVKEYPMLYDSSLPQGSVEQKQEFWREITQRLKNEEDPDAQTVYEVKQRWKNLRDSYVKDVKLEMYHKRTKTTKAPRRPYRYSKYMTFLKPFVLQKGNKTAVQKLAKQFNDDSNETVTVIKQEPCEELKIVLEEATVQEMPDESSPMTFDLDPFATNASTDQYVAHRIGDRFEEIDSFFKGISDVAKTLSPVNQILLQRDVANMVFDLKLKELRQNTDGNSLET